MDERTIPTLLSTIHRRIPQAEACRTDYLALGERTRRVLVLEGHRKPVYLFTSAAPAQRQQALRTLLDQYPLQADAAVEVLDAGAALAEINPYGAWPLTPDPQPARVLDLDEHGGLATGIPGLAEAGRLLQAMLPTVAHITLSTIHREAPKKGQAKRTHWASLAGQGRRLADLQLNLAIAQIREQLINPAELKPVSERRLAAWERQLAAPAGGLAVPLSLLLQLGLTCGLTEIRLRPRAADT
jgi:hypothetical protein